MVEQGTENPRVGSSILSPGTINFKGLQQCNPFFVCRKGAARQSLAETMNKVIDGHDAVIITRQKAGSVVMMSLEDFNSMQETLHLLGSPNNAALLRQSIADAESGNTRSFSIEDLPKL